VPGRGGGSGRIRGSGSEAAFSFGVLACFAAAWGFAAARGFAAALVFGAARGFAAALVLGAARGFAAAFVFGAARGLAAVLGVLAAVSVRVARLVLRRSGREVGSEPRTLEGGVSLITPVSPGA
jgi:hypothetical protein